MPFRKFCNPLQDKEQSNTEMFFRVVSFILLYLLEGKKRIVVEGEGEEMKEIDRFSITRRIVFHILFILLPLSLLLGCSCISMVSLYFFGKYIMLAIVGVLSNSI